VTKKLKPLHFSGKRIFGFLFSVADRQFAAIKRSGISLGEFLVNHQKGDVIMGKKSDKKKLEPAAPAKVLKVVKVEKGVAKPAAPVEKPKFAPKEAAPVAKKATAISKPAAKPKATSKPAAQKPAKPSFEQIQLQAFFVAERRFAAGLPGDSESDWVQAEKELLATHTA